MKSENRRKQNKKHRIAQSIIYVLIAYRMHIINYNKKNKCVGPCRLSIALNIANASGE